jgi:hypothetical protein
MARATKSKSSKQRRPTRHIEKDYESRGVGPRTAKARAYGTMSKKDVGPKRSSSGRKTRRTTSAHAHR